MQMMVESSWRFRKTANMKVFTYEEVLDTIEHQRRFGRHPGVEVSGQMLHLLGDPQEGMPFIHIAGTNGKGSVAAFLCAMLQQAGLKTGMFTSPHLVAFEERIRVDGKMIEKADVTRLGNRLLQETYENTPTMFDYCLGMAMLYFKEQNCDVVILETGLGGRLDSTNAVGIPEVSVITKIGYDHMEQLGHTLPQIAAEKAGILKKGTCFVMESQEPEVLQVLFNAAKEAEVEYVRTVRTEEITDRSFSQGKQTFSFEREDWEITLCGNHQYENAAAAILGAELFLKKRKIPYERALLKEGLKNTCWPGRMEVLSEQPYFLVDGAHNSNGVRALSESLRQMFPGEKFHFKMGVMADKDYEEMITCLLPLALDFETVTVDSERALQADVLAAFIREKKVPAVSLKDWRDCVKKLQVEGRTVAFGSLYFIGEIKKQWNEYLA